MRSWVHALIFLLVMNGGAGSSSSSSGPPSIPFLTVSQQDTELTLFTNQTTRFTPQSFNNLQINCQAEDSEEPVNYYWNLVDVPLGKADTELEIENGTLIFLEPNYGIFECLASNSLGTSYSVIELTKHDDSSALSLKLVEGPLHLTVPQGSLVRYTCTAESTDAVQFTWTWNTQVIGGGNEVWIVEKLTPLKETLVRAGVSPEDTGNVGCRVSSDSGSTLYQEGSLRVLTDPGLEAMKAPNINIAATKELLALEGEPVKVECKSEGVPEPVLSWKFGSMVVAGGILDIESVSNNMSGDIICRGVNAAGTAEETLTLNVLSPSSIIENAQASREFLIGQKLRLECNYQLDKKWEGNFEISWHRNGQSLEDRGISVISSVGMSVLEIESVVVEDEGNYTCALETPLDSAESHWTVRTVSGASILHLEPRKLLLIGTMAVLSCPAAGRPPPQVKWFFNGDPVGANSNVYLLENGDLRLDSLEPSQAGEYKCLAVNAYGQDEKVLNLSVARPTKPATELGGGGLVEVRAGEVLRLECSGVVDPLLADSALYSWTKDGAEVDEGWVNTNHSLVIPYLLAQHAGTYVCQIRTLLDIIRMESEVVVRTLAPSVERMGERGSSAAGATVAQVIGGPVSLQCTATGIPAPTILFKHGGSEYSGRLVSTAENKATAVLDIIGVTGKDEGEYICLAVNEYGNSQGSVVLDVMKRTVILTGPSDIVLKSGQSTSIPCKVSVDRGLADSLEISWLRNQNTVYSLNNVKVGKDTLMVNNLTKRDEGIYSCLASTAKDRTSLSGRLTVLSEGPSFTSTPRDIRILEGRNTELVCQADGIPLPRISWTFGDRQLESQGGTLALTSLSLEKQGNYICTADNMYGSVHESVNLQVIQGARKENKNLVPDIVKNIKDTISLPCEFKLDERIEEETRVLWFKENVEIPTTSAKYKIEPNRSLEIRNIELGDEGQYACKIITPLQEVESKISLIVSGESPEILNAFDRVTIHEGEALSISCVARGVPTPSIQWYLKDTPVSGQYLKHIETANSEFRETRVIIKHSTKGHEGVYQCVAKNNVGTVVKNSHVRVLKRTKVSILGEDGRADITVPAGQKLKLPCKVDNDDMNRITGIVWTKDDEGIQVGGKDIIDFGMDNSITIINVQKRHEGLYKCTVTTVKDQESAEIPLRVLVNAPVITKHSKNQIIFSGTTLQLECISTGIPEPSTRWTFNRTITNVTAPTFDIKNAISADAGSYTCTSSNSIGETQRTIVVSVVTLPPSLDVYQAKQGATVRLPCVRATGKVSVLWLKGNKPMDELGPNMEIDRLGSLVLKNLTLEEEGEYKCKIVIQSERKERIMSVKLMPDIVTIDNTRLEVKEGDNFTLKCDVLPGVSAKRMWKKDGQLVFPESGSGLDILEQGGILTVLQARHSHSGEWECIASTAWGEDTIIYTLSVPSRTRSRKPCSVRVPPVIKEIFSTSNTSVVLEWQVLNFNSSCFQEFMIFWWSKEADSTHDNQTIELKHRKATIRGLKPSVAYYFQVNLVRDKNLKDYIYGQTKSHIMQFSEESELSSANYPKAVIIIVILVIVVLVSVLVLVYLQRGRVSEYLAERNKAAKHHEFAEYSSKLVANPDFMASLAPQWPEPEPEPHEAQAFIPHQRPRSRRNSRTSITSSWSSLFNVKSNENLDSLESSDQPYRAAPAASRALPNGRT